MILAGREPTCRGWIPFWLTMAGTSTTKSSGSPSKAPRFGTFTWNWPSWLLTSPSMMGTCCSGVLVHPKASTKLAFGSLVSLVISAMRRSRFATKRGRASSVSGPPHGSPNQCFLVSMSVWYHHPPLRTVSPTGNSPYMRYWCTAPRDIWTS